MKGKQAWMMAVLLGTLVFSPSDLPSCGPFFPQSIFTTTSRPALPLDEYVKGRLGVLQQTYGRAYLLIAYRYLSGNPLSAPEQKAFLASKGEMTAQPAASPLQEWLDARGKVNPAGASTKIGLFRSWGDPWQQFPNCPDDAFRNARATLEDRIRAFGIDHPGIRDWVAAQDAVFANCSAGTVIPPAAEESLPQPLKYDRQYQIAAALFYAMRYDEAARQFRAIAAEKSSPWCRLAPYLIARCLIRQAVVPTEYGKFDAEILRQAEAELQKVLQDAAGSGLQDGARGLMSFVALRLHPLDQLRSLSARLQNPANFADFLQDLTDYQFLLSGYYRLGFTLESARQTGDMTDWILAGWNDPAYSFERWKATGNTAWLLSTISRMKPGDPGSAEVIAAARKLSPDSPAYATAQYHYLRLLEALGRKDEARTALDEILPGLRASLATSSVNLFLAQRMRLARSLEDFLQFAPRFPAEIESLWGLSEGPDPLTLPWFDTDSVRAFDAGLPLAQLCRAALSKSLPAHLHEQVLRAAWVRAILLSNQAAARGLAPELRKCFPELANDLRAWLAAAGPEAQRFASAVLMLHFPGLSPYVHAGVRRRNVAGIDNFRENWWCGFNAGSDIADSTGIRYNYFRYSDPKKAPEPAEFPAYLGAGEKAAFDAEWKMLAAVETAPNYLGKIVLSWAAKNPQDPRVPEALHLVVKATRFGCTDDASGTYSRKAFQLLHGRYAGSPWAKATPYWYK